MNEIKENDVILGHNVDELGKDVKENLMDIIARLRANTNINLRLYLELNGDGWNKPWHLISRVIGVKGNFTCGILRLL